MIWDLWSDSYSTTMGRDESSMINFLNDVAYVFVKVIKNRDLHNTLNDYICQESNNGTSKYPLATEIQREMMNTRRSNSS